MGRRIRDVVHGLIVFDNNDATDMLAWKLIDTKEFQRLRRIRQLGVSDFTFPGAVHTRFSHSIGVFHTARILVGIVKRERDGKVDEDKADVAKIAALLHDLGHGPFSHTFEGVQDARGVRRRHEQWTASIIRNPDGLIYPILESHRTGFTEEVATLLEKEDPEDIYHAIVSSSFDADRLDYLRRDRLMTGTGAGAVDFDWLIDNVRVAEIELDTPNEDEGEPRKVPTFCLTAKALPAAEQFLLARYTLHEQIYFHKTTRCVEKMIGRLLKSVADCSGTKKAISDTGLGNDHPLVKFFRKEGETVNNYLALDDALILGALDQMSRARDPVISDIALRLKERRLYKTLDIADFGADPGSGNGMLRRIEDRFKDQIKTGSIIVDQVQIGIYAEIGGDEERMHKRLHILDAGKPVEITRLSKLVQALEQKKPFRRIFFANPEERDAARRIGGRKS